MIEAYFEGMKDIRASIFQMWEVLGLGDYSAAPLSFVFDPGSATHLAGRLRGLTRTLGMFRAGYLPPEQAVEELTPRGSRSSVRRSARLGPSRRRPSVRTQRAT